MSPSDNEIIEVPPPGRAAITAHGLRAYIVKLVGVDVYPAPDGGRRLVLTGRDGDPVEITLDAQAARHLADQLTT